MRQKESLTGEASVLLLNKALQMECKTVSLTFSAKTQHDLLGPDDEPLRTAALHVEIPIEHFLFAQSAQLEGGQRVWNWEIVFDTSVSIIRHLYLLSTQWSQESAQDAEERLADEKAKYNSLMKDIIGDEEE